MRPHPLFDGIPLGPDGWHAYFVHSYHFSVSNRDDLVAETDYGTAVAHHTGRALQITNILRDVDEDASIGRVYLPRELLEKHDVDYSEPTEITAQPGFVAMWRELAEVAHGEFVDAEAAMNLCRKDVMRPARIMKAVYQRNLERMMALPDATLADPKVSKRLVGSKEKLLIAVRHGFF